MKGNPVGRKSGKRTACFFVLPLKMGCPPIKQTWVFINPGCTLFLKSFETRSIHNRDITGMTLDHLTRILRDELCYHAFTRGMYCFSYEAAPVEVRSLLQAFNLFFQGSVSNAFTASATWICIFLL